MRYLYCAVIPPLLQILTVTIIIKMNTGNGSWVGLGVFIFSIPILPATTVYNAIRTKTKVETKTLVLFGQNLLIAYIAPVILVAIFILFTIADSLV